MLALSPSSSRAAAALLGALAALAVAAPAQALDVQANAPQVAGDPGSDTTARFPTNKQNEPSIAVNPVDASRLIAGSNDEQRQPACGPGLVRGDTAPSDCSFFFGVGTDGVYTSSNGGSTWSNRGLLDDQASWQASPYISDGDPVIVYGPKPAGGGHFSYANGARAYYVGLGSYKGGQSPFNANKAPELILVSYSDDNGVTWSTPVRATTRDNPNTFNDKNSAWADDNPASPSFGNVYVGFTAFRSATATGAGNEPVFVTRSTDGGTSFGASQQLSPAGNNGTGNGRQGSDITSGPDGSVYVAFEQGGSQVVAISRDGGTSYAKARTIGPVTDLADPIPGANFRTDSFPSIGADPRGGSSRIYASWSTRTANGGRTVVASSSNRGVTWSTPVTVSSAAEGYALFDALDVAPNGRVDVGFQGLKTDHPDRFGTGNAAIDAYTASAPAGGAFGTPVKTTSASSDPAATAQNNLGRQFWGDYNTMVSTNAHTWFIATDARTGEGCPAVDAYQKFLSDNGLARDEELEDRFTGQDGPAEGDKPAPPVDCPPQFGNSDVWVSITG
ncbi:MAG: hypothetical protein JWO02_3688 [Solirubrobacterales bacterium]|nr:hypothetical protein [Solirubrobacterales bacterium]